MTSAKEIDAWVKQGVITSEQAKVMLEQKAGEKKEGNYFRIIMMLGGLSLILGILAVIGANWNAIPDAAKLGAHALLSVALGYGFYKHRNQEGWARDIYVLLVFGTNLTFVALIGQVFQTQSHPFFAILIWMLISSPLVLAYTTTRFVAYAWIVGVIAQNTLLALWLADLGSERISANLSGMIVTIVSSIYIVFSNLRWANEQFPLFAKPLRLLAILSFVLSGSMSQILWRIDFDAASYAKYWDNLSSVWVTFGVFALLTVLSRVNKTVWEFKPSIILYGATVIAMLTPALFIHPAIPLMGAVSFIAYWLVLGYVAHLMDNQQALDQVVWVISLRIFIIYLEVFGTLASTGIGMIIGGLLFIGLGYGTRRVQKYLRAQHGT
ncbi:MAG: DUF2157 domain-containing protein [Alphaproteobacteria bacterium]|nr:DUF2157 domain-containing protein [Alphaproteobacteria bacterium]